MGQRDIDKVVQPKKDKSEAEVKGTKAGLCCTWAL